MRRDPSRSIRIGVAGGSGSGKTTVVRRIVDAIGPDDVVVLHHDSYYRDGSHLPPDERAAINYDHPDSLETELPTVGSAVLADNCTASMAPELPR